MSFAPATVGPRRPSAGAGMLAPGAIALLAVLLVAVAVIAGLQGAALRLSAPAPAGAPSASASAIARRDIPPAYLLLYERAAERYGVDWAVLAAIGKVECDHGRDPDPSCSRSGATNAAGAGGPMQFIASTWTSYGVDGNGDGRIDRWSAADAIYSAANYLHASGAPVNETAAIFAYNHASWYVAEVQRWAASYREAGPASELASSAPGQAGVQLRASSPTPVVFVSGERAQLMPADGHVALIPAAAPPPVQATVIAGNELQGLAYGPGGHPDPRGAVQEDCSSTINYLLYRAGIRPIAEILRDNPLAQDYTSWGAPGPGRWVSIYATQTHVFAVVAGLRLDTSHNGTDVGPNRLEDGPRWRVFASIPSWARWSVRHPPGL